MTVITLGKLILKMQFRTFSVGHRKPKKGMHQMMLRLLGKNYA